MQLLEFAPAEDRLFRGWAMEQVEAEDDLFARLPVAASSVMMGEATLHLLISQLPQPPSAAQ